MPLNMAQVTSALTSQGWASARGTLGDVRIAMTSSGFLNAASSRGRATTVLRPYAEQDAPQRSLSAVYGLSEQPLHSDGAHLPEPPDVIVLFAAEPSPTSTVVWGLGTRYTIPEYLAHGVFTVRGNGGAFLASAYESGRLRFDPVCMSPGDLYARDVVTHFKDVRSEAHIHEWAEPNTLLFIDNRRALHARNAVGSGDLDRKVERLSLKNVKL